MKKLLLLTSLTVMGYTAQAQTPAATPAPETPTQLVQRQLEAYNAHDVTRFAATYAENAEVLQFPAKVQLTGRTKLQEVYGRMFSATPALHCELVHRTVLGNRILDHERITGLPNGKVLEAVVIYEVENGLIRRATVIP
ncbi:nuclear transport factor 2 family protein [Hymenobacter perfusus]|uniref:Steroid delta-isomerase n=1 Tax=Hymenobacter perfusus TaxID=1236770 RepID=A0A3R9UZL6_9BACT|nr:nuclear transport factor 2 family protein [Hymenobacter perfusus]RSK43511.1 steroid delta-isomerase [Hymenobacter perfusus]